MSASLLILSAGILAIVSTSEDACALRESAGSASEASCASPESDDSALFQLGVPLTKRVPGTSVVTPLLPTEPGWTYYFEAVRACPRRFFSYAENCGSVDLWSGAGGNQELQLLDAGDGTFYLKMSCGYYVSYTNHCENPVVDSWKQAGANQKFRIVLAGDFRVQFEALGRSHCPARFVAFEPGCASHSLKMAAAGGLWYAFPVRSTSPPVVPSLSPGGCADPWMWGADGGYKLICTGGSLPLYTSAGSSQGFRHAGSVLPPNSPPPWSRTGARWAPETIQVGCDNFVFFSSPQGGVHRIGWARASNSTGESEQWKTYAGEDWFDGWTAKTAGGEIDPHVFFENGKYYLVWKSDDNAKGSKTTRLWMQGMAFEGGRPRMLGAARVLLDAADGNLWWITSWAQGGALIEGPELIRRGQYYYLFFASGRYCRPDYAEGVARSKSLWGPYEKLPVPLLSTGMVGNTVDKGQTVKLVGPGHAGFLEIEGDWYAIWHASPGHNCNRRAYSSKLRWLDDWPVVE